MTPSDPTPRTDAGRWLLDHQGLVNIGKIDGSMRGDEIDLRAAIVTIEEEAAALSTTPAPACRHDAKWIEEFTSWVIRAHEERAAPRSDPMSDPTRRPITPDEVAIDAALQPAASYAADVLDMMIERQTLTGAKAARDRLRTALEGAPHE